MGPRSVLKELAAILTFTTITVSVTLFYVILGKRTLINIPGPLCTILATNYCPLSGPPTFYINYSSLLLNYASGISTENLLSV